MSLSHDGFSVCIFFLGLVFFSVCVFVTICRSLLYLL